ncbi:MAG: prolipoprotein diacylglyceryl transferase [Bacteroidetes bacterium]|nr:prolipoprotein diacylglyceryl transferase [Bacteroidota bacterium]
MPLSFIVWDPNPDLFTWGGLIVRWYGLLFASGFLIGQQIMFYIFRKEGKSEKYVEMLTIYMMLGTIIGARLGHVVFYEPGVYFANPIKILKIWEGGLASHGATVGILLALFLYVNYDIRLTFSWNFPFVKFKAKKEKKEGQSYLWILDRMVILVALTGCLIRFGNFMNSEIEGIPTRSDYGVIFARAAEKAILDSNPAISSVEATKNSSEKPDLEGNPAISLHINFKNENYPEQGIISFLETQVKGILTRYSNVTHHIKEPTQDRLNYRLQKTPRGYEAEIITHGIVRHPAQLYESVSSLLLFVLVFYLWYRKKEKLREGQLFAIFLIILFGLRFFYEFIKENQVTFENNLVLNMGQLLSIPLIIIGVLILLRINKNKELENGQGIGS